MIYCIYANTTRKRESESASASASESESESESERERETPHARTPKGLMLYPVSQLPWASFLIRSKTYKGGPKPFYESAKNIRISVIPTV